MSGHTKRQATWEETNEEVARRRKLAQSGETGWIGTVVGLSIALVILAVLTLMH